tara:strand:- start:2033 stop:2809 length:777 start_codon:yes stop_codon:yes gene_type:complete
MIICNKHRERQIVNVKKVNLPIMLSCLLGVFVLAQTPITVAQPASTQQGQAIASTSSELAQRHYRRGNTYSNLERFDEAAEEYRLAVAADPNLADAYRNLANIYLSQENTQEAIPMLVRFIDLHQGPVTTPLVVSLKTAGQLLRGAERFNEAITYDLRAIDADPEDDSQVHIMGNTYNNAGETDKAIMIYEKAVEVMPQNAFMYRTLGRLYEDENRLEDALALYRKAAEIDLSSQFYRELVQNLEARIKGTMEPARNG